MIVAFGGNFVPDGWLATDGSLQPIAPYVALFEAIGATYGGNGATDFALPNLNGAAAVGAGQGPGLPPVALGQKVGGTVPGLGLNFLICTAGIYPPPSGNGSFPPNEAWIGQVVAYAGARPPSGWALCDGSLIPIEDSEELFNLIGTAYGGDGETVFALPDLRGRMLTGQ
jgi:microcystin-dependent protein